MADGHSDHDHGVSADTDRRYLTAALTLILAFMAGEVAVGLWASSLALISDAAHMLTDAASIVLAIVAMRLAAKPPRGGFTYGLRRAEILSAQANGVTLLVLAVWLTYEGVKRLIVPPEVTGPLVLGTALVGVAVNIAATWLIGRANRRSLNVQGAFQHILNDLYAFIATVIAGAVMTFTGFDRADAIATFVVVALMVKAGIGLIKESARVFLEAAPADLSPATIGAAMAAQPGVDEVHDLHIWEITSGMPAASAHILVARHQDCHAIRAGLMDMLADDFDITHATLQVDHVPSEHALRRAAEPGAGDLRHCEDTHGPSYRAPGRQMLRNSAASLEPLPAGDPPG